MAERRMFAKSVVDSDAFLDMPLTTQALYFHLSMRADDEGFIGNPKKIVGMLGAAKSDFRMLIKRDFIIQFDSGVVAIKHWKTHNYISPSKLKPTAYSNEKQLLLGRSQSAPEVGKKSDESRQLSDDKSAQVSIEKDSIDKESSDKFNSGETSIAKPSALLLAKDIKNRNDIMRVYANNFKLDLCDFVIETLTEQAFSDRQVKGHCASEFRDFAENYFDAEALARLVNKLIAAKEIADKRSYLLTIIAEEYL